ncbi:MAG: hypothetical protein P4L42_00590 [Desulfocapsaceae bacterium]|nr:hypothetical protein [Desulfocapsaceae bacterium]
MDKGFTIHSADCMSLLPPRLFGMPHPAKNHESARYPEGHRAPATGGRKNPHQGKPGFPDLAVHI